MLNFMSIKCDGKAIVVATNVDKNLFILPQNREKYNYDVLELKALSLS